MLKAAVIWGDVTNAGLYSESIINARNLDADQPHLDQLEELEPLHGLPHRCAGDVQLRGDGLLVDHLARADGARQDEAADHRINLFTKRVRAVEPQGGKIRRHSVILI